MPLTVRCPCGKRYKVNPDALGKSAKCKACGKVFTVTPRGKGDPGPASGSTNSIRHGHTAVRPHAPKSPGHAASSSKASYDLADSTPDPPPKPVAPWHSQTTEQPRKPGLPIWATGALVAVAVLAAIGGGVYLFLSR